jgi:hypothetical protein
MEKSSLSSSSRHDTKDGTLETSKELEKAQVKPITYTKIRRERLRLTLKHECPGCCM